MELLSWIGALLIGLVLGLFGSGGSILTVPVLVYLVGEPEKLAFAESLGIVTLISLIGVIPFARKHLVHWRSVVLFGLPGMAGAYGGAFVSQFISGMVQLMLFAAIMLLAAVMMLRRAPLPEPSERHASWKLVVEGFVVGVVTGLVGVGGGFLIVPALVLLGGLSMHMAVGTSLAIIALKGIGGFYKYVDVLTEAGMPINWSLVLLFGAIGIVGSFAGKAVGGRIPQERLKRAFAVFLLVMGALILMQSGAGMLRSPVDTDALPTSGITHVSSLSSGSTMFGNLRALFAPPAGNLSPDAFIEQRTDADAVIDVRAPAEYAAGHLAGSENIDLHSRDFRDRIEHLDRERTYFLYCRSGARSGTAARMMRKMGFTKVYNIGGLSDLARAGLPTKP